MAEEQTDKSQKTEEPTQKKLEDARQKGQVASSREVNHWFMILGATVVLGVIAPLMMGDFAAALRRFIAAPHAIPLDAQAAFAVARTAVLDTVIVLAVPLCLLVVLALAGGLVQNGLIIAVEPLQPKLSRISLIGGAKRLFSTRSLVEFAKGVAKIAIVGTVATVLLWPELGRLDLIAGAPVLEMLDALWALAVRLLLGVLAVMTLIAVVDFSYQRFEFRKQMRMSRQELKDEFKQTEGDPLVRSRLRQIRQERARRRMMAAVPEATVVVTNPTHYAVALKYEPAAMAAPLLVAKGVDALAQRIREVAEAHDVPIIENRPLAQALHAGVEIGQEVPAEHYRAVAEIIGYVMRLKRGDRRPYRPGG